MAYCYTEENSIYFSIIYLIGLLFFVYFSLTPSIIIVVYDDSAERSILVHYNIYAIMVL